MIQCDVCSQEFKNVQALRSHERHKHSGNSTESEESEDNVKGIEVLEEEEEEEEEEAGYEVPAAIRVSKHIPLDPDILIFYSLMKEHGGNISLPQFINDCMRDYMESKGYEVTIFTPEAG